MKKFIRYIMLICIVVSVQSCIKDLQSDMNDGGWNHERSIINIQLENQVGTAEIENTDSKSGLINLTINTAAVSDWSNIKLKSLQLSYQAKSSMKSGETLDLNNADRSTTIEITSATGETREYTLKVSEFTESLEGSWNIEDLTVYGGTGPEYGGGGVFRLADKPWCWPEANGPETECDNLLMFKMTGILENGNTTGTCNNEAGPDGKYADFIFIGSGNKDNPGVDVDVNQFYRQIPEGESTWERDYSTNTITFTDKNGVRTMGKLVNSGTEDLGNGLSMNVKDNAFTFDLNGTDDWTNIYTDYDKFVKKPRKYWISVSKQ